MTVLLPGKLKMNNLKMMYKDSDQLSLTNPCDALHHAERATNKLATELSRQRFASKVANFQSTHMHSTYTPTCIWRLRCTGYKIVGVNGNAETRRYGRERKGKEEYLYSAFLHQGTYKALRHGSHSFTCKQHHACLSFMAFTRCHHHSN